MMALSCVCVDCGRQFAAERDERLCNECWECDTETFANVPPNPLEPRLGRYRRPSPGSEPPPAPVLGVVVPEDMPRLNYHGGPCKVDPKHGGPFVSHIGRPVLCHECARKADRIELSVERRSA